VRGRRQVDNGDKKLKAVLQSSSVGELSAFVRGQSDASADVLAVRDQEVSGVVTAILGASRAIESFEASTPTNERSLQVMLFLFGGLNALATSSRAVGRRSVVAGRQPNANGESVAMALLCTVDYLRVFEKYCAELERYPVHKAIDKLKRADVRQYLGMLAPGRLPRGAAQLNRPGMRIGAEFDEQKVTLVYRKELSHRRSSATPRTDE
jgi:hypothetical protein